MQDKNSKTDKMLLKFLLFLLPINEMFLKTQSSARAASVLNQWAISIASISF